MTSKNRKRWSNIELLTLGDMYRDGAKYSVIASKLGRSEGAIRSAINIYRDVINIDYRYKRGGGRKPKVREESFTAPVRTIEWAEPDKPWWKFWA